MKDTNIKITKQRHRNRARNGCCSHNEVMRCDPFVTQLRSLLYTESMLFINNHQSKSVKTQLVLN